MPLNVEQELAKSQALLVLAKLEMLAMQEEMEALRRVGPASYVGVHQMSSAPIRTQEKVMQKSTGLNVTKGEMRALILRMPRGRVEACLLKLWSYQTEDERVAGDSKHRNGRGFSKKHVGEAKTMVVWIKSYAYRNENGMKYPLSLLRNQSTKLWANEGLSIVLSYARQLAEIVNEEGRFPWDIPGMPMPR